MKLRKIVTMGMATLMAVSAMSLSAFACENPEDAIISVLAPDGENRLYLSQEDIDNGITTVTGYQGIEVTANPDNKIEIFNSTVTPRILSSTYFKEQIFLHHQKVLKMVLIAVHFQFLLKAKDFLRI